jgi:hypothetical protein
VSLSAFDMWRTRRSLAAIVFVVATPACARCGAHAVPPAFEDGADATNAVVPEDASHASDASALPDANAPGVTACEHTPLQPDACVPRHGDLDLDNDARTSWFAERSVKTEFSFEGIEGRSSIATTSRSSPRGRGDASRSSACRSRSG